MSEEIIDGTGKGYTAQVDSQNRLVTFSISEPEYKALNKAGLMFSVYISVTPAGANDYFFYLKNTGVPDLAVTDIRMASSVSTTLYYDHVTGTPTYAGATAIVPTNRNLGSSKELAATINKDTDITGLTNQGTLFIEELPVVATRYHLRTSSNIIIPQGSAIAFKREAATGLIEGIVSVVELS